MEITIMEERDHDIGFAESKKVSISKHFVTLTRFHKLGEESKVDMVMFTPEEAEKMALAVLNGLAESKKASKK